MIIEQSNQIIAEVNKAFIGKNDIVEKEESPEAGRSDYHHAS